MVEVAFDTKARQKLFLEFAARPNGTTAQEVHAEASLRGDRTTVEAYHNLGRRLAMRGYLRSSKVGSRTTYKIGGDPDEHWLDEDRLADVLDAERPLDSLAVLRETRRQLVTIPEPVWAEVRSLLLAADARSMFCEAIEAYADDLRDSLLEVVHTQDTGSLDLPQVRARADRDLVFMKSFVRFGLGLSTEAVNVPPSVEVGMNLVRRDHTLRLVDPETLRDEISRRIEDGPMLKEVETGSSPKLLVAAVDGSTRGGLLTLDGEDGDASLGAPPMVSVNCAVAHMSHPINVDGQLRPTFLRLPERPEDIQRAENRFSIVARPFYPDMTESQYAHAVWAAMNLLEFKAARRVMRRWEVPEFDVEVPPADVVLLDGTVIPNDRDSNHYAQDDTFGRLVRELVECTADLARNSQQRGQVVAGLVKNAQMRVVGPVVTWFLTQKVGSPDGRLRTWPMQAMNALPDQALMTRILTAGRHPSDVWLRSCYVLRPFYAATDLAERVSRSRRPGDELEERSRRALLAIEAGQSTEARDAFWAFKFDRAKDDFAYLLDNVWCAAFFLGAVPRLDGDQSLPRHEFLVPASTREDGTTMEEVERYGAVFLRALRQNPATVAQDHAMFGAKAHLDIMPRIMLMAHDLVKTWAEILISQVKEHVGQRIASYFKLNGRTARLRPWKAKEIEVWKAHMRRERGELGQARGRPRARLDFAAARRDDDAA